MYYVYLLKLSNQAIYTGSTSDPKRRVKEHEDGKCESTRNFRPLKLIWYCAFPNRLEARKFENYLKTGTFRNEWNKNFNLQLASILESTGFNVFLPQRDSEQVGNRKETFLQDIAGIDQCKMIIAENLDDIPAYIEDLSVFVKQSLKS